MKLKNAKIYKFSSALRLKYLKEILLLISKFELVALKITELLNIFAACVDKEDTCYKIVRKSNISMKKEESDKARDAIIIGIKHAIKSGLRHFNDAIREAAQRLKIVFDTYDKPIPITNMPYDAETMAINKLLLELNGKYAADAQILGIDSWLIELEKRNNAFDDLAKNYNEETAEKPVLQLVNLRKETNVAYHELVAYINALMLIDKETPYEQFASEFNALVKHYNDTMAQHIGRIQSAKKEDDIS
jgi:hypothetical protein